MDSSWKQNSVLSENESSSTGDETSTTLEDNSSNSFRAGFAKAPKDNLDLLSKSGKRKRLMNDRDEDGPSCSKRRSSTPIEEIVSVSDLSHVSSIFPSSPGDFPKAEVRPAGALSSVSIQEPLHSENCNTERSVDAPPCVALQEPPRGENSNTERSVDAPSSVPLVEFLPDENSGTEDLMFLDELQHAPFYDSSDTDEDESINIFFSDEEETAEETADASILPDNSGPNETLAASVSQSSIHVGTAEQNESAVQDSSFHNISIEQKQADENSPVSRVKQCLKDWALQHNIPHVAISSLAKGLKQSHPECLSKLPEDARTFLKNDKPQPYSPKPVAPGAYIHLGLLVQLIFLASLLPDNVDCIPLLFNIDGLPLFEYSISELWPILMLTPLPGFKNKVLPIGLYYGPGKPKDWNVFFHPFIDELLKIFLDNGFDYDGRRIRIVLLGFSTDTPARSYILGTKGHTGFFSCFRCVTEGESVGNRRIFPVLDDALRNDMTFRLKAYAEFQLRDTPLLDLPGLHFTRSFPLDYLHLCCLGVTRTFARIWFKKGVYLLEPEKREAIQNELNYVTPFIPSDFSRKPTNLLKGSNWKGTEARLFMCYESAVVLKDHLPEDKYTHFLLFSIAMTILLKPTLCKSRIFREIARQLLLEFVTKIKDIYDKSLISHNFHSLIHLVEDADFFVDSISDFSLNDLSCFPFENFMQLFKRLTRARNKPLAQLGRRFWELFNSVYWRKRYSKKCSIEKRFSRGNHIGPLPPLCRGHQYRAVSFGAFKFNLNGKDDVCGTTDGEIIEIKNIVVTQDNEELIVGQRYLQKSSFYCVDYDSADIEHPGCDTLCSTSLGVYKVSQLSSTLRTWPLSSICTKYVRLPHGNCFVVLPMLHSDLTHQ